jgi:hypothetical protein
MSVNSQSQPSYELEESIAGSDFIYNDLYSEGSVSRHSHSRSAQKRQPRVPYQHILKRIINQKMVRITVFETNLTLHSTIRNAITGTLYPGMRVGTRDEHQFFSVVLATGELGQNSVALFFENPEQYERHFYTTVQQEIKTEWKKRQVEYSKRKPATS